MARAMKDSGVEWIGEIPEEWGTRRLRFLCSITTGNQDTQDNDPSGEYPFYVRSPIVERSNKFSFEGDAILMAGDGVGAGKIFHYVSGKYGCHQRVYSLQKIHCINRRFLYYYLQNRFYVSIETANSKSTVDSVRLPMLQDFPVTLPPNEEQELIASFLDSECARIDAVIEQTRASIEEYKKLKQSVITQAVTKGIRPGRKMKDSGVEWIGEIPEEWHIDKIAKVASFHNGDRSSNYPSGDDIVDEGILFITSNNLGNIILNTDISSNKYITQEKYAAMRGAKLRINDIVFCLRGSVGKCSINKSFSEGTIASSLVVIRPECIDADFLNYALQNPQITELALLEAIGIGSQNLAASDIAGFKIPIPSEEDSESIVSYLKEKTLMIEELIQKKVKLLTELESYKKSLIFEYVTGKRAISS